MSEEWLPGDLLEAAYELRLEENIEREIKELKGKILKEIRGLRLPTLQRIGAVLYNHPNGATITTFQKELGLKGKNHIYKALNALQELGWVDKKGLCYLLTKKGKDGVNTLYP
ncbi:MAG: hypothetical protein H3Z53_06110 [archaeon]|nr:hypothetical protein [archaeon]MCP8313929.1 hypothetical protein [archaeon]